MSKLLPPRTNTAYRESKVPKNGELLVDSSNNHLYLGDGVTPGGLQLGVSGGTVGELTAGFNLEVTGSTIGQKRFKAIETLVSGGTVFAGHAYKIVATSGAVLNAELFDRGITGLDATVEIFLNGTGYIQTGNNLVIKGALEPDAINNCIVRFHDGDAALEVVDNIGGYIVIATSGSTAGTLPYALTNVGLDASEYIAFSQATNGTPIDFAGTEVDLERHVVGNGYTETILSGTVSVASSGTLTMAAVGLQNVTVVGGTLTLGDAYIPSGSTVAVSGGGLAVEKVTGAGETSVINGGGVSARHSNSVLSSVFITNTKLASAYGSNTYTGCTFSGNIMEGGAIGVAVYGGTTTFTSCAFLDPVYTGVFVGSATAICFDCDMQRATPYPAGAKLYFVNSNIVRDRVDGASGTLTLTSGAIVDLTGNPNATPIAPGGGITFEQGGATVKVGDSTASSSYMMDNVTLPAGANLTNTNVVNLGGSGDIIVSSDATASIRGCVLSGGSAQFGGAVFNRGTAFIESCTAIDNQGNGVLYDSGTMTLSSVTVQNSAGWSMIVGGPAATTAIDCIFNNMNVFGSIGMSGCTAGAIFTNSGTITFGGNNTITRIIKDVNNGTVTISSGASINLTSSIEPGGGITVLTGGCTVNGNAIPAGTYTSIDSNGQPT